MFSLCKTKSHWFMAKTAINSSQKNHFEQIKDFLIREQNGGLIGKQQINKGLTLAYGVFKYP